MCCLSRSRSCSTSSSLASSSRSLALLSVRISSANFGNSIEKKRGGRQRKGEEIKTGGKKEKAAANQPEHSNDRTTQKITYNKMCRCIVASSRSTSTTKSWPYSTS